MDMIMFRVSMIVIIKQNAELVREIRGLPENTEEESIFFDEILANAPNKDLLNLLLHSEVDAYKHHIGDISRLGNWRNRA